MTRISALVLLFIVGALLGVRGFLGLATNDAALLGFTGRAGVVEGTVADDPDRRASSVRVTIAVAAVNGQAAAGKVLAVLPLGTTLHYGDRVVVRGLIEEPQAFLTDTGRTFDYPGYLKARGISALVVRAELREHEAGSPSLLRGLFALKHTFERALERVMREPHAALMEGLLLGEKSGLPEPMTQAFIVTGLIHIVVLSGYNIGIVAEWVLRFLTMVVPRRPALALAAGAIVLFALMVGGGMATVRACLMGLIAILARYLNRPAAALRALLCAAAGMALWNPLVLVDVGFILSVLATFGLITLSPWVETKLAWLPAGALRSTAATTIAVQLYVLPALLYFTGVLSFVSIPVNVLVLPLVPLAMLLGFVAGMLALVHPYLGFLPGLFAEWVLGLMMGLAEVSAGLPVAAATIAAFPWWVAAIVYLPLTAWAAYSYRRSVPAPQTS